MLPFLGGGHKREAISSYDCFRYRVTVTVNNHLQKKLPIRDKSPEKALLVDSALESKILLKGEPNYFDPVMIQQYLDDQLQQN